MELLELTAGQYSAVYNMISFGVATMFAAFIFFVLARQQVAPQYRGALVMSAIVVAVAGYHYLRIFESWSAAYTLVDGIAVPTGAEFNDAYRYVDWVLTVPLLVAELVAVLGLSRARTSSLTFRLGGAAALMVIFGFPGEIADSLGIRALWGAISTIPFVYLVYVLWTEMSKVMGQKSGELRVLYRNIRLLLLGTWGFYPIVYLLPILGIGGGTALVAVQIGYTISDVLAKALFGVVIYMIAREKSTAEGWSPAAAPAAAD